MTRAAQDVADRRPAVSIVVPFAGDDGAAARTIDALARIRLNSDDELIVVDNSAGQVVAAVASTHPRVIVVAATRQASSYYARNRGAETARGEWVLFVDSDCIPTPELIDAFFAEPTGDDVGAIAGGIVGDSSQSGLTARYSLDRGYLDQSRHMRHPLQPYAVTANLLVRASALRSVGGFLEGIRSGGDTDFCWRLQEAGWRLDYRPMASVVHSHRETLRSFSRVTLRYAAGRAWLNRRYPGAFASPGPLSAGRALASAIRWVARGRRERGTFRAIDGLVGMLDGAGALLSNRATTHTPPAAGELAVFTDSFPELSETFVGAELDALRRLGQTVRVEARFRPRRQDRRVARAHDAFYLEDESVLERVCGLAWLLGRHPFRCLCDLAGQRRWGQDEPVTPLRTLAPAARRLARGGQTRVHAHFAANAALNAMRLAAIRGLPYSVTAHAYEIFREPRNLIEKLKRASLITTGCDYNVAYLGGLVDVETKARIHKIVMGVDAERFARSRPYPHDRTVIAVGRLVEKKGFAHLIDAVARLQETSPLQRLTIIGDGPLMKALVGQVRALGLEDTVRFLGALDQEAVRIEMEQAALLAMPCVIAADGDRDSMPVVVKEALALEIPVVATDEVGLPELVKAEWGRLVPPADPDALGAAISELMLLGVEQRMAMGAAGRRFVREHCSVDRESERLAELLGLG